MKKIDRKLPAVMVYCGPDIPFVAKQFDSFSNGLPEQLMQTMEKIPAIASLVIPVERLAWARTELMKQGSALQNIFVRAEEEIKRGR